MKNLKYKAVIFDLDGVICHTDRFHYEAWKCLADELGIYFDKEINNRLRGISRMDSLEIILEKYNDKLNQDKKIEYANKKNEWYKKLLENMSPEDVSPEVRETLLKLRSMGIKLAIGSSSKNARLILEKIGLNDFFDEISDGNKINHSKPDPEVFLKASENLGFKPEECLVVEDAVSGIEAAIAGGMDCAAVGDAAASQKGTYDLGKVSDLTSIVEWFI